GGPGAGPEQRGSIMKEAQVADFGSWKSPIMSELIASKMVRLMDPLMVKGDTWWLEMRPEEQGRYVVVRRSAGGEALEVIPAPFSARSRVHEYGGRPFVP